MPPFATDGSYYLEYELAFKYIKENIANEDLWEIINAPDFNIKLEADRVKIYNNMKANCGKYKFIRIW
jgi:hypothetical protein